MADGSGQWMLKMLTTINTFSCGLTALSKMAWLPCPPPGLPEGCLKSLKQTKRLQKKANNIYIYTWKDWKVGQYLWSVGVLCLLPLDACWPRSVVLWSSKLRLSSVFVALYKSANSCTARMNASHKDVRKFERDTFAPDLYMWPR